MHHFSYFHKAISLPLIHPTHRELMHKLVVSCPPSRDYSPHLSSLNKAKKSRRERSVIAHNPWRIVGISICHPCSTSTSPWNPFDCSSYSIRSEMYLHACDEVIHSFYPFSGPHFFCILYLTFSCPWWAETRNSFKLKNIHSCLEIHYIPSRGR